MRADEFALVAEQARREFAGFVRDHVNAGAHDRAWRCAGLPLPVFRAAAEAGLLGFALPTRIGGTGRSSRDWGLVLEEVAFLARDQGFTDLLDITVSVARMIADAASPDLVDRYARPLAAGRRLGTVAVFENRDRFDERSTARRTGGGWRLSAHKPIVAGALLADVFLVSARDPDSGDTLVFLVERTDPGVLVRPVATAGAHSVAIGSLTVTDLLLDDARLLWPADGLSALNLHFNGRRVGSAAATCGTMRGVFEDCLRRLTTRHRGGRVVLDFPNVQLSIGRMRVAVESSRAMLHRTLAAADGLDPYFDPLAAATKQFVTDQGIWLSQTVLSLMGGEGYLRSHPWERVARDMLGLVAGSGPQETLLLQIGEHTAGQAEHRRLRMERITATVTDLLDRSGAAATVAAALETGMLDLMDRPVDVSALAGVAGLPEDVTAAVLEVLVALGLVHADGARFTVDAGCAPFLHGGPERTLLARALDDSTPRPRSIVGPGGPSIPYGALLDTIVPVLARELDGFDECLHGPSPHVLHIGRAEDGWAAEFTRRYPGPELTSSRADDAPTAGEARFDLVWICAPAPAPLLTTDALRRLRRDLRPGGWLLIHTLTAEGEPLGAAVSRLRSVAAGGSALPPDEIQRTLRDAGYIAVQALAPPAGTLIAANAT
ncbi:acyl-CoA dehydrogenase family protein [Actinomadura rubrisoli]|uniref:Acyl-CoA dehydrogenase n=1 Tax=Actinomadura rubrisoli TaxID=2530368 RepID=A0A4V2YX32_9ACTN|nr:acyl-CoA dehydrogenase family protein [Actinomadura rubrisoli]TDD87827.1 acyl-CoA dehydrogenase [Actinomadura rubrisoli]